MKAETMDTQLWKTASRTARKDISKPYLRGIDD